MQHLQLQLIILALISKQSTSYDNMKFTLVAVLLALIACTLAQQQPDVSEDSQDSYSQTEPRAVAKRGIFGFGPFGGYGFNYGSSFGHSAYDPYFHGHGFPYGRGFGFGYGPYGYH